jgi:hypothetical protein
MTVDVVACGQSGKNWVQHDYSIGVNDSWKWGKPTDALLLCNAPFKFPDDRFQIIKNSTPKVFYSNKPSWSQWFPEWKQVTIKPWYGTVNPGQVYYSDTSPFIAISLAYTLGAKQIILWGVDFYNHHIFNSGNPQTKREVERYLELIACLKELDISVFVGAEGSVFDEVLPLFNEPVNA